MKTHSNTEPSANYPYLKQADILLTISSDKAAFSD